MQIDIFGAKALRVARAWAENSNSITLEIKTDGRSESVTFFGLPTEQTDKLRACFSDEKTRINDGQPTGIERVAA